MKEGITRQQSSAIQGTAILLMLWHHFFSDIQAYGNQLYFAWGEMVWRAAWFGKICVALFAFVSGYGMFHVLMRSREDSFFPRLLQDYGAVLRQLFSLYLKYWLVFLLLPGAELLAGVRTFDMEEFIGNFLGISSTYQQTWWYMWQYVKMLMLLPFLELLFFTFPQQKEKKKKVLFFIILSTVAILLAVTGLVLYPPLWEWMLTVARNLRISYFMPFYIGFLMARFSLYQRLAERLEKLGKPWNIGISVVALCSVVAVRVALSDSAAYAETDFLLVPIFVYALLTLLLFLPYVERILIWFGKQSTYMWLTHVYICAYLGTWLAEHVRFGLLFYLILLALSAAAAALLNLLTRKLLTIKNRQRYNDEKRKMR